MKEIWKSMVEKIALLVTDKEKKLIEKIRQIKFSKEVVITVVDGQPTEIGIYKDAERL
jgi:hypothetical protein